MTKYHVLFMKEAMVKATNIKNNYIAKTKIINKIQYTKTHKNHTCIAIYICLLLNVKCQFIYHLMLDARCWFI